MTTRKQFLLDLIEANPALNVKVRKHKKHIRTNVKTKVVPVETMAQLNLSGEVYFFLEKNVTLSLIAEEVMVGLAKDGLFYSAQQVQSCLSQLYKKGYILLRDVTPTEVVLRGYHGRTQFSYSWSADLKYKGKPKFRKVRVNPGVTKVTFIG